VTCLHLLTNVEPFTLYDVLENEYQWRQFLNGKVVSDKFGKLLDRLTFYKVKERPNSVLEALQELGTRLKTSNPVNTSVGVYSFKAEELKTQHRLSIPSSIPNKQVTKTTSSNNLVSNQNAAKPPVELRSSQGIDYRELERLLKTKEWLKADKLTHELMRKVDKLTYELMQKVTSRKVHRHPVTIDEKSFPCEDLLTIDQLWVYYSNGKFGFSIQKKIWLDLGGKIGIDCKDEEIRKQFYAKVGWNHLRLREPSVFEEVGLEFDNFYWVGDKVLDQRTFEELVVELNSQNAQLGSLPFWRRMDGGVERWELSSLLQRLVDCNR
jgi:hypothetical protein